jgi:hypothetical protein
MKKKIFLIIFSFLLIFNFALAQIFYFSSKNSSNGLMIGVEVFDQKTKSSIKPLGYSYEWTLPDISLEPQKTKINLFFSFLPKLDNFFFLNLKITKPFTQETYFVKNQKIFLSKPKAKIVRKTHEGILLPLLGKLKRGDSLTVITKDFASKNLTYVWEFNGVFVSNEKEIKADDLKEKSGTIKVKVFGEDLKEKVEDFQTIQIE